MFYEENIELLQSLDAIQESVIDAEFGVLLALSEGYSKVAELTEYADEEVLQEYAIVQEYEVIQEARVQKIEAKETGVAKSDKQELSGGSSSKSSSSSSSDEKRKKSIITKIKDFIKSIFRAIINFFKKVFHIKGRDDVKNVKAPTKIANELKTQIAAGWEFCEKIGVHDNNEVMNGFRTLADLPYVKEEPSVYKTLVNSKFGKAYKAHWGYDMSRSNAKTAIESMMFMPNEGIWRSLHHGKVNTDLNIVSDKATGKGHTTEFCFEIDPVLMTIDMKVNIYDGHINKVGSRYFNMSKYLKGVENYMDAISSKSLLNTKSLTELVQELGKISVPANVEKGQTQQTYYGKTVDAISSIGGKLEDYESFSNKLLKHAEDLGKFKHGENKDEKLAENEAVINTLAKRVNVMILMIKDASSICNGFLIALDALRILTAFYGIIGTPEFQRGVVDAKTFKDKVKAFKKNKTNEPNTTTTLGSKTSGSPQPA